MLVASQEAREEMQTVRPRTMDDAAKEPPIYAAAAFELADEVYDEFVPGVRVKADGGDDISVEGGVDGGEGGGEEDEYEEEEEEEDGEEEEEVNGGGEKGGQTEK